MSPFVKKNISFTFIIFYKIYLLLLLLLLLTIMATTLRNQFELWHNQQQNIFKVHKHKRNLEPSISSHVADIYRVQWSG